MVRSTTPPSLQALMRSQLVRTDRAQPYLPCGVPLRTPTHPGRFLERQFLKPLGLTQGQAARLLGVSRRRLNEIVVGRRSLSPDTALRCAVAFGLDASFWMALQARWDSHQAWRAWRAQSRQPERALPLDADEDDESDASTLSAMTESSHSAPALAS